MQKGDPKGRPGPGVRGWCQSPTLKEIDSPLGGEMSGHIFFKHEYYGFDDAIYAAVRLSRAVHPTLFKGWAKKG